MMADDFDQTLNASRRIPPVRVFTTPVVGADANTPI